VVKFVRLIIDKNNKRSDKKNMVMLSICSCEEEKQEEFVNDMFECDMKKVEDIKQIQEVIKNKNGYNIYTDKYIFVLNEVGALEKSGSTYMFRWN